MLKNRIAVNVTFFLNGFIYANWVSRLPRIQELFSLTHGTLGIVLLTLSLGAVTAMPFTGWLIIKNGSRTITLLSLIGYCIFVPFIPLMPGFVTLIMLYIGTGLLTGMLDVAMNAQAVMVEQQYRRPIMTSFHAYFSVGMALGAWCGALFADLGYDLIYHFVPIALFALVAAVWVSFNLVYDKPAPSTDHSGPLFRLPGKSLTTVGIIAFCCMLGEGAMSDWSVNYMEKISKSTKSFAPIGLSAFATAMTIGRIFGDRLRSKYGDTKLIVFGGLLATAGLAVSVAFPDPYVSVGGFFLVGMGLSTIVPITYSIAGNERGLPPGVGLAMVTTVGYAGFLFGPAIIGFVSDAFNLRFGLSVVLILFGVMTMLAFQQRAR